MKQGEPPAWSRRRPVSWHGYILPRQLRLALGPSLDQPNNIPELTCPSVSEGRWAASPVIYGCKRTGKVRRSELHESVHGAQARASMLWVAKS